MKVFTKASIEELHSKVNLAKLVKSLGITDFQDNTYLGICPICKNTNSFAIENVRDKCYCFECEFNGNSIDLLMSVKLIPFDDAVLELAKMFDVKMDYKEYDKFPRSKYDNRNKPDLHEFLSLIKQLEEML